MTLVSLVEIMPTPGQLRYTFSGPGDVTACTGNQFQAAGDLDGDYHEPTSVVSSSAHVITLQYADTFTPGNAAWVIQSIPPGIVLNGSTFPVVQGGDL